MIKKTIAALALSCLLLGATRTEAAYAINGFIPTAVASSPDNLTLGYSFTLSQTVFVQTLSIYDSHGPTALVDSHDIGIFDSKGNAVVTGTVNQTSAVILSPGPNPQYFATQSVAQTMLVAGTYRIGATYVAGNEADQVAYATSAVSYDPAVSYNGGRFGRGLALTDPTSFISLNQGYFGPNFTFTLASVPEPSSIILTSLGALGLLVGRLARGKKIAA